MALPHATVIAKVRAISLDAGEHSQFVYSEISGHLSRCGGVRVSMAIAPPRHSCTRHAERQRGCIVAD